MNLNKGVAALALAFCLVFLVGVALVLARFEAEGMSESSTGVSSVNDNGTQSLKFVVVGAYAQKGITLASPAESIEVRARTSVSENKRPTLRFFVDGHAFSNSVMDLNAGSTYASASKAVSIPAGSHTIYVKCVQASTTPDSTDGDCTSQRSAFIDWISFSANDADGDGIADASDNCPNAANASQENLDADGQGDACDADIDGDGHPNDSDYDPYDPSVQDPPPPGGCTQTVAAGGAFAQVANTMADNGVLCLRGGVYQSITPFRVTNNRLTIKSYPGEVAEIRGSVEVNAPDVTLEGMKHRGQYGETTVGAGYDPNEVKTWPAIEVNADRVTVKNSPLIENQDPANPKDKSGQAISVSSNDYFSAIGNHFGPFGEDGGGNNHQHAIYTGGDFGTYRDNSFNPGAGNGDRCFQLYPDADSNLIEGNLVYRCNDVGLHFSGRSGSAANDNTARNNVIAYSHEDENVNLNDNQTSVSAFSGNVVSELCAISALSLKDEPDLSGIQPNMPGVSVSGVVVADPQVAGSFLDGTAKVTNPVCAAKLPLDSRFLP